MNAAATTGTPSPARTGNGSCPGTPTPETSAPGHSRPRPDNRTGTAAITASPRTRSRRPLAYPITGLPNTYGWAPARDLVHAGPPRPAAPPPPPPPPPPLPHPLRPPP